MAKGISGVDLFCGIGGLTHGLIKAGIKINAGFDTDETCRVSYEQKLNKGARFINQDVKLLNKKNLDVFFEKNTYKIIAGCAPCQPYSKLQKKSKQDHPSYGLIEEFLRIIKEIKPEFVIMENVPSFMNDPCFKTNFFEFFQKNNYLWNYKIVNLKNYGWGQSRRRLIFVAIAKTVTKIKYIDIPEKTSRNYKTVYKLISKLPKLANGQIDKSDFLHQCSKLEPINLERMQHSVEGGTWKDWPTRLLPNCYRKKTGLLFLSVYGRLDRNSAAPTLTTQFNRLGCGRYGHYEQNRALSLREGAILQSFPKNYKFDKNLGSTVLARQIGNAVPPLMGEIIGKLIISYI